MYYEYDQPINPPENPYEQAQEFAKDDFNREGGGRDKIVKAIEDAIDDYLYHLPSDWEDCTLEALHGVLKTVKEDI